MEDHDHAHDEDDEFAWTWSASADQLIKEPAGENPSGADDGIGGLLFAVSIVLTVAIYFA